MSDSNGKPAILPEHIEAALITLDSDDVKARSGAIELLGKAQHRPAVPYLTDILRDFGSSELHFVTIVALGSIGDDEPLPELLEALRGRDMWIRAAVAGALIKIGLPSVPGLIEAIRDPNKAVRRAAAKALGKIGDETAVPVLSEALNDPDRGVRDLATEALERIDGR